MQLRSTLLSATILSLVSTPSLAFFNSDLTLTKVHPADDASYAEKEGVTRSTYQLDNNDIPQLNALYEESKRLPALTHIDLSKLNTLAAQPLQLTYQGKEATALQSNYTSLITDMQAIEAQVLAEEKRKIDDKKKQSTTILEDITSLEANKLAYLADIQVVLDRQIEIDKLIKESEQTVNRSAIKLADIFNDLGSDVVGTKGIAPKKFEKVSIKYGDCKESVSISGSSIKTGTEIQGYCFTTKIPVKKKHSEVILNNTTLMASYHSLTRNIYDELIKQGEADNKSNLITGYRQEAKAFSHGTIRNAEKAAIEKYGSNDKGLERKIKTLNKKYKQSQYNINAAEENMARNSQIQLRKSPELNALKPTVMQLNQDTKIYLNAFWTDILGKSDDSETAVNYKEMEVEIAEKNELTVVVDTYNNHIETYLIDTNRLDEAKDSRDLKNLDTIPVNIAVMANALMVYRGTTKQPPLTDRLTYTSIKLLQAL